MYNIERKSEILNLLEKNGRVDVGELADLFQTSKETIRRDLRELEHENALRRTHGGAIPMLSVQEENPVLRSPASVPEYSAPVRGIRNSRIKELLCQRAASFIEDGDTVFVDNSSTTTALGKYVNPEYNVTFITNSLRFLSESASDSKSNHTYICLGGIFHPSNLAVFGNGTLKNAQEYFPNKAFLSCTGITSTHMLTDSSIQEIDTKKLMIQSSSTVFILADHTKFERNGQIFLSDIKDIDFIITDAEFSSPALQWIHSQPLKLITL